MADEQEKTTRSLAIGTLVVASSGFLIALYQLLAFQVTSATGLPNCDEKVMGEWGRKWWRSVNWLDLFFKFHLQVRFHAPVILVSWPDNKKGPEKDKLPKYILPKAPTQKQKMQRTNTGFPYGKGKTQMAAPTDNGTIEMQQFIRPSRTEVSVSEDEPEPVHTVNNEMASWVVLLNELQEMETLSEQWDEMKWHGLPRPTETHARTLAVGTQRKMRTFDRNPAVSKPYATTTICHLVELAAMLGLHWKKFDRDNDMYRAEGNGYNLMGWRKSDFGLVFEFKKFGWPAFRKTRLIPTHEVKELCFGNVPTLFRPRGKNKDLEERYFKNPFEEPGDPPYVLKLGSKKEIVETMGWLKCTTNTARYIADETKETEHLFPVVFELIGLLSRRLHIKGRSFTYLPNPAPVYWNQDSFSAIQLLLAFRAKYDQHVEELKREWFSLYDPLGGFVKITVLMETLSKTISSWSPINAAAGPTKEWKQLPSNFLEMLHDAVDEMDGILQESRLKGNVVDVVRAHIEAVMDLLNVPGDGLNFLALKEQSKEDGVRENQFMKVYFRAIHPKVVRLETTAKDTPPEDKKPPQVAFDRHRQVAQQSGDDSGVQSMQTNLSEIVAAEAQTGGPSMAGASGSSADAQQLPPVAVTDEKARRDFESLRQRKKSIDFVKAMDELNRDLIWCTFICRMICWLTLHDFHKRDVQLPKAELLGNRLPVYIM